MAKLAKKEKAGRDSGNIVVDLGEEIDSTMTRKIDQKLAAAGIGKEGKEKMAGSGEGRFGGYRPGGYRPGMFGYRPWYADKDKGGSMGASESYAARWRGLMRPNLAHLAVGAALGALGDIALMRVTPDLVKTDSAMVHTALAFAATLVPVLVRPNSYTLGIAAPGAVLLAASMFNYAMDSIGIKPRALRGADGLAPRAIESSVSARQKLAEAHSRMNPGVARIQAQAI